MMTMSVEHDSPGFNRRRTFGGVNRELVVWDGRDFFEWRGLEPWLMDDGWYRGLDRDNERVMLGALKAE
jgi:hypothetical protein